MTNPRWLIIKNGLSMGVFGERKPERYLSRKSACRESCRSLAVVGSGHHPLVSGSCTLGEEGTRLPAATLILSNPPFGTKKGGGLRVDGALLANVDQLCITA